MKKFYSVALGTIMHIKFIILNPAHSCDDPIEQMINIYENTQNKTDKGHFPIQTKKQSNARNHQRKKNLDRFIKESIIFSK